MIRSKRILCLILVGAMTMPCFACKHEKDPNEVSAPNLSIGKDGVVWDFEVKDVGEDADDPMVKEQNKNQTPAVTTYVADNGDVFVAQTDINGASVTEPNGAAVTVPFVTETVAAPAHAYKSYQALWVDTSKKKDFIFDGEFLVFDIEVKSDAKDGAYPFEFYYTDFSNYDGVTLDVKSIPGYVVIGDAEIPETPELENILTLVPESVKVKAGDTAKVIVNVRNNPGFCGFNVYLHYDSNVMSVQKAYAGSEFSTKASLNTQGFSDDN